MFKLEIDWDKAHPATTSVEIGAGCVQERNKSGTVLRVHTVDSLLEAPVVNRPCKVASAPPTPSGFPQPPCPAPVNTVAKPVQLERYKFEQLLSTLKQHATSKQVREDQKLTLMEIHEQLLAMKE